MVFFHEAKSLQKWKEMKFVNDHVALSYLDLFSRLISIVRTLPLYLRERHRLQFWEVLVLRKKWLLLDFRFFMFVIWIAS